MTDELIRKNRKEALKLGLILGTGFGIAIMSGIHLIAELIR